MVFQLILKEYYTTLPIIVKEYDGIPKAKTGHHQHHVNRSYKLRPKATQVKGCNLVTLPVPIERALS